MPHRARVAAALGHHHGAQERRRHLVGSRQPFDQVAVGEGLGRRDRSAGGNPAQPAGPLEPIQAIHELVQGQGERLQGLQEQERRQATALHAAGRTAAEQAPHAAPQQAACSAAETAQRGGRHHAVHLRPQQGGEGFRRLGTAKEFHAAAGRRARRRRRHGARNRRHLRCAHSTTLLRGHRIDDRARPAIGDRLLPGREDPQRPRQSRPSAHDAAPRHARSNPDKSD